MDFLKLSIPTGLGKRMLSRVDRAFVAGRNPAWAQRATPIERVAERLGFLSIPAAAYYLWSRKRNRRPPVPSAVELPAEALLAYGDAKRQIAQGQLPHVRM